MKIAIFENEYEQVKVAFEVVNELYYHNNLKYEIFVSSQQFVDLKKIVEYALILIDIDLSRQSDLDGYSLIKEIIKINKDAKIIILTGSSKIEEKLKEFKLPPFPILMKPLTYVHINDYFKKYLPTTKD